MIMEALAAGFGREPHDVITGEPPDDGAPFVVWGQEWLTLRIVPQALRQYRPFWLIDNGYWNPARGTARGYYKLTYRSPSPILLPRTDDLRIAAVPLREWRKDGRHILLAMPGVHFGMAFGSDVKSWCDTIPVLVREIAAHINRPVKVRPRDSRVPLANDLRNCWALVTHSSNVAVDAGIAGIPVFVAPTSPAAPIGRLDLELEHPVMPQRKHWLRSLASQHFTLDEMRRGVAWHWMQRIAAEVDNK